MVPKILPDWQQTRIAAERPNAAKSMIVRPNATSRPPNNSLERPGQTLRYRSIRLYEAVVVANCLDSRALFGNPLFSISYCIANPGNSDRVGRADLDNVLRAIHVDSLCCLDCYFVVPAFHQYPFARAC